MALLRRFTGWFDGRRRVALGVLVGWMLIIAAAAGDDPDGAGWVGVPDLSSVLTILFAIVAVLGIALHLYLMGGDRGPKDASPRRLSSWWLGALVFFGLLSLARAIGDDEADPPAPEEVVFAEEADALPAAGVGSEREEADGDGVGRSEVVLAALAAVAGLGGLLWLRRTDPTDEAFEPAPTSAASVSPAFDRALEDLDASDDPRLAVLRAYASLETALAGQGMPRRSTETAAEHLGRTLAALPVDHLELSELGALYERARYSATTTTDTDRDRARMILDRARADLRPPAAR